ncbi:MAG: hypothetical protein JO219_03420 [Candidatus Eremiobacteraeota bacterium]|nr:hypothetical protein [Candidatus Eremiobacteraeota bacterium]MBV8366008.1 hypothetical protein [Candidatus Eremiobacteraeota bacterium]
MKRKLPHLDLTKLKPTQLSTRPSKVSVNMMAAVPARGESFADFWAGLPDVLAAAELRELVGYVAEATRAGKVVAAGFGGHVIKTGLSPLLIDLMRTGVLSGLACNGSVCIHDVELALAGKTSEDVDASLRDGSFGMSADTADFILGAIAERGAKAGLGRALGDALLAVKAPHADVSILAQGAALDVPVTVHVAIGTDIIHMHPRADGAALGAASLYDFRLFADVVAGVTDGGAYLNFGSAVIMPEVFLKALSMARNLGYNGDFVSADFDFIRHYRTRTNVVTRPHADGGRGYMFTGHHEIMIPLFCAALKEALA